VKNALILCCALIVSPIVATAQDYKVDQQASSVSFAGNHAGTDFVGLFGEWSATVSFDADNLAESKLSAEFDLSSAETGNAMYDGTLPAGDWFDTKNTPMGTYQSTELSRISDHTFHAVGELTLRGFTIPVEFDFVLSGLGGETVQAKANFPLLRLDLNIGRNSDEIAEWVTNEIGIEINLVATLTN
jgi:polyisoprenoid-binding protein YceI